MPLEPNLLSACSQGNPTGFRGRLWDPVDVAESRGPGGVLLLETFEEMPGAEYVYRVLMGMEERGLLEQLAAVAVTMAG